MATTFACPKGHASADHDFCSECGAKIAGEPAPALGNTCPDCRAPIASPGINFCEICGYNFVTRTSGQVPADPTPEPTPPPIPSATPAAGAVVTPALQLTIAIDPALRTTASPEPPENAQPIQQPIGTRSLLIGRRSEARAIFPDVPLDADTAVSHRHGMITQASDGQIFYRDLGSSNGTRLNGTELKPLADTPLKAGDQLTLGHWTRITIEETA